MKIGLFSIGLDTYWDQFDGLLDNLKGHHAEIHERIGAMGVDVVDAGMVCSPSGERRPHEPQEESGIPLSLYLSKRR
jgi:predicted nucleotidyltransferase